VPKPVLYHHTMNGVIIGRFMPPHNGHLYLIDFARHMVDTLYILVCTLSHEPIPGDLRYRWVRELAPTCKTIHITEEIPEARRGAAGATAIWAETVRKAVPDTVSRVFASEEYGWELAAELNADFVPVDPGRNNIPVSATTIRRDPYASWRYIPPTVRPYFVKHVAVVGSPETTNRLADQLDTVVVHSYRSFWQAAMGVDCTPAERAEETIRRGVLSTARALARQANRILLYDVSCPRNLSEVETVDAVVCAPGDRDACLALIPERPVFDVSSVSADELEKELLKTGLPEPR
jgi:HTH-type transcriptional regulator, transcriptional repressor of NAD biosynthesis genes